jgi:hypothetical protein
MTQNLELGKVPIEKRNNLHSINASKSGIPTNIHNLQNLIKQVLRQDPNLLALVHHVDKAGHHPINDLHLIIEQGGKNPTQHGIIHHLGLDGEEDLLGYFEGT